MSVLNHFSLPYIGMKDGLHQFDFVANQQFFNEFEDSPIKDGNFDIHLEIDKRSGHSVLDFDIRGGVQAVCDRCLADVRIPIQTSNHIHVKILDKDVTVVDDDDEVLYMKSDDSHLNLAHIVYEFIVLALPLVNIFDCENEIPKPCDVNILARLQAVENETPDNEEKSNELWSGLKNLDLEN